MFKEHSFSFIAILIGIFILIQYFRLLFFYKYGISKWNTTEGLVITNSVVPADDEGGSWINEILYEYEVDGRKYKSKRYTKNFRIGVPFKHQVVPDTNFKEETVVVVYYDPDGPGQALLDSKFDNNNNIAILLSLIAFFLAAYYW